MADPLVTYVLLCLSSFLAGAINAVAGGGTLLTFPALLAVVSPIEANATSTMSLIPGSLGSGWGYRAELAQAKERLRLLWAPSFFGGILGALAVTRFPEKVFAAMVPWLLIAASTLLLLQKPLSKYIQAHPHEEPKGWTLWGIVFFQFLVGIYGGYFGAGIGILMLSALSFMGIPDIHRMNGVKAVLGFLINGITAVIFVVEGVVVWKYALAMAVASTAGGYLGARGARRLRAEHVRALVVTIGFAVAGYSFWKRFGS
ncbi:MAG: sulfite exporter TauE/SafE family protein [Bryobacterales bacterium]|nr:sulfite exporter TauE/SafE family protein [Bryobacterales bacterium]